MKRKGIHRPTIEEAIELSAVETLHPGGLALTRRTAELAGIRPGLSVLDVSCGRGTQSVVYAREFGADVVGLDLSQAMLETAKARASEAGLGPSVRFVQGDSQDLPFPDGSFDVVVNECAVGIPDDSQKVLNEMLRVARPGGRVLMHESTWRLPLPTAAKEDFAERYGTTPLEVEEWVTMLERAGAKRISVEEQPWSRPEMFWKIRAGPECEALASSPNAPRKTQDLSANPRDLRPGWSYYCPSQRRGLRPGGPLREFRIRPFCRGEVRDSELKSTLRLDHLDPRSIR